MEPCLQLWRWRHRDHCKADYCRRSYSCLSQALIVNWECISMRLINKSLKAGVASRAAYVLGVSNSIFANELILRVFFDDTKCIHGLCERSRAARQLIFGNALINSAGPFLLVEFHGVHIKVLIEKKLSGFKLQDSAWGDKQYQTKSALIQTCVPSKTETENCAS